MLADVATVLLGACTVAWAVGLGIWAMRESSRG